MSFTAKDLEDGYGLLWGPDNGHPAAPSLMPLNLVRGQPALRGALGAVFDFEQEVFSSEPDEQIRDALAYFMQRLDGGTAGAEGLDDGGLIRVNAVASHAAILRTEGAG